MCNFMRTHCIHMYDDTVSKLVYICNYTMNGICSYRIVYRDNYIYIYFYEKWHLNKSFYHFELLYPYNVVHLSLFEFRYRYRKQKKVLLY